MIQATSTGIKRERPIDEICQEMIEIWSTGSTDEPKLAELSDELIQRFEQIPDHLATQLMIQVGARYTGYGGDLVQNSPRHRVLSLYIQLLQKFGEA